MADAERLIRERIEEIENAIAGLQTERAALQRVLYSIGSRERLNEVSNPRSYRRIYNENKIISVLKENPRGLGYKAIGNALMKVHGIKMESGTLRSYLSRMREKEMVQNKGGGVWIAN